MNSEIIGEFIKGFNNGFKSAWYSYPMKLMKIFLITMLAELPLLILFILAIKWNAAVAGIIVALMLTTPLLMVAYGIYGKFIPPPPDWIEGEN